ncbi:MAG TPA: 5-oxoprolinase subunit PxpB [Pyrinomonadaceae bacterium]|nr:5-oxoprolinase subunit PxpB [Pyrinomonadaceae bacterium]
MRIFPLGENALTVEFGNEISLDLNRKAIDLAEHFQNEPFPGLIETVPAYASTTVFYDPTIVRRAFRENPSAFDAVRSLAEMAACTVVQRPVNEKRVVDIPIIIDRASAPDLNFVSEFSGLPVDEVISTFVDRTYRVYMLGFLPGFPYMGEVDERIAAPRKQTPRVKVTRGSVGIAGKQTGIYSLESPGGWQIIGRTEMEIFDPVKERPCALQPGDEVRFMRV